jgi:tetratricopeptide (TPR) repeat protein
LPINSSASNKNQVEYYIDYYGQADINNELVRRVQQVFEKVSLVADKRHHRPPELTIIKGFNNPNDPLALALPDGHIVLSQQAIDIIYKNVSLSHGDTRAAFVLGHELAHLAKDDFWHREFLSATKDRTLIKRYRDNAGKNKEIEADDRGFNYAAMAGYPVDLLLGEGLQQQNFLVYWQEQTFQGVNETHPEPEDRAKILQTRLQTWLEKLPYFHFGVRLSHFGRCDDAIYFLREFLKDFAAREVQNNLGVCELQRARQALGEEAYSYWLPSVLDATTPVKNLSSPYASKGDAIAKKFLKNAKGYFKSASEMEPDYVPAHVNLAITTLYLGEIYEARAAIEKARQLAPNDLDIQGLRAVILYEEGKQLSSIDMWPYVMELLEKLAKKRDVPLSVLYNTAQLLEQRKRTGADEIWQSLAQQAAQLPVPIAQIVCKKAKCPPPPPQSQKASWDLPVKLGVRTKHHKTLHGWKKNCLTLHRGQKKCMILYNLFEQIYQAPDGSAEVLGMKGRVEMVVLKKLDNLTLDDYCGQPLRSRRVHKGTLWSCENWAALVVDEKVKEVWVVKQ